MTVRDLLALPRLGLTVVAGDAGLDRPIRWAHTSELQDPTPWLSGGELLLTTGMSLVGSAALQRAYVKRLAGAGLAGLGFGVGFGADEVPAAIKRAADAEGFPVIEVPYPVPFIAIAEAVSSALAEDRLREARMSVEVHERLAALVSEGGGPADVLEEAVDIAGGWAVLFDARGGVIARAGGAVPDESELWKSLPRGSGGAATSSEQGPGGTRVALAVETAGRREAWAVFGKDRRIEARDRIAARHAVTVLGLLLASRRAVVDAERRIAGDVLTEGIAGRLSGDELARRLALVGFPEGEPVAVLVTDLGAVPAEVREEAAWMLDAALGVRQVPARTTLVDESVATLVAHPDPEKLAGLLLEEARSWPAASERASDVRIGVGGTWPPFELRRSYLEATFALRAAGPEASIASPRDLGSYSVLLGGQPREALEGFVRSVLGPLIDRDVARSSDLVASVRAFIESGGRWEPGAESLAIHRHTLRYRVRQAEDLLGRDLTSAEDRMEIWLALKAMEVLER
jgi:purine catabolism regulator